MMSRLKIEGVEYQIENDPEDPFISPGLVVAFCRELAGDFKPVILDPKGEGGRPNPPEFMAHRLVMDPRNQRLCLLFEVYWRRQDCTWKQLNKDHDHDYEQIQIHFNTDTGKMEKVVVSSVGLVRHAGHGIEVYLQTADPEARDVAYTTSPKGPFPWGGKRGRNNLTQVREVPIDRLVTEGRRPVVLVLNCYHAFLGLKKSRRLEERNELEPGLRRLDRRLLETWYYRHAKNRFGHDISNPFPEPHVMYYPPPEDWKSRLVYGLLWALASLKGIRSR